MGYSKPLAPALRDLWYVVATATEVTAGARRVTTLFDTALTVWRSDRLRVAHTDDGSLLPVIERYGCIWTSFGTPSGDLFPIAEYGESDRYNTIAGSFGVTLPATRAADILRDDEDEGSACRMLHPCCAVLYKSSHLEAARNDVVALFCQPLTQSTARMHLMVSLVGGKGADAGRWRKLLRESASTSVSARRLPTGGDRPALRLA